MRQEADEAASRFRRRHGENRSVDQDRDGAAGPQDNRRAETKWFRGRLRRPDQAGETFVRRFEEPRVRVEREKSSEEDRPQEGAQNSVESKEVGRLLEKVALSRRHKPRQTSLGGQVVLPLLRKLLLLRK